MKILITGASNGMGLGVAQALAARDGGAHELLLLCRSRERGEATVEALRAASGNEEISLVLCDLARLDDVQAAIDEIRNRHHALDAIFVNAGIGYAARRVETVDGLNEHFQVNYLSHFLLVLGLLDRLERSEAGPRVVFNATQRGEIRWDDLQMEESWGFEDAIHQAMAAKRMLYLRLHALYEALDAEREGPRPSFYGFQIPKAVWSNQLSIIPTGMRMAAWVMRLAGRFYSVEECGTIMAPLFTEGADAARARSGSLTTWEKDAFAEIEEDDPAVLDPAQQARLWETSLALLGDERTRRIAEDLARRG